MKSTSNQKLVADSNIAARRATNCNNANAFFMYMIKTEEARGGLFDTLDVWHELIATVTVISLTREEFLQLDDITYSFTSSYNCAARTTYGSRECANLTNSVCLTDLTCAS